MHFSNGTIVIIVITTMGMHDDDDSEDENDNHQKNNFKTSLFLQISKLVRKETNPSFVELYFPFPNFLVKN